MRNSFQAKHISLILCLSGKNLKKVCFPLPDPTLSKLADRKCFLLESCSHFFFFFLSFHSKFALLKIPYFRFALPKDRYFCITEHIFVVKKPPTYLPTHFQNCGSGKGKQKYF